ncbi:MAG: hypothetical protein Q7U54_16200 [Bacteroidales bacterium]|nr:hypothetical protein [Bacteroidales bacterium]
MEKIIEHRVTDRKYAEEQRTVYLSGYYSLLEAEIKKLEENKVSDMSNQTINTK